MTRTITDPTTIGIPKVRQCFKSTTEQYVSYLCKSNKLVENDGNNDRSCNEIVIENLLVVVVVVSVPNGRPPLRKFVHGPWGNFETNNEFGAPV